MTEEGVGKAKGGFARAEVLTSAERSEIAKKAANERWSQNIIKATHGSPDHPLRIGDLEIPCYVLSDGRRVLHHRGLVSALGMARGSSSKGGGDRLVHFITGKALEPFISAELTAVTEHPIKFKAPNGKTAYGYEAQILADICDAVLEARKQDRLQKQQQHIADRCEILLRGFARVGIIALVDEATGYQKDRAKDELAKILEAFVAKELQPWVKTFQSDFYEQMFRLRGLPFPSNTVKRPQYFGHLTNDVIYYRLAPGVWKELKEKTEKSEKGRMKHKLFQKLTPDLGHPKLRDLLASVTTIMKLSDQWLDFKEKLDRIHPSFNETLQLPFDNVPDDGKGI
jgi:hypothetical protein